jgi:hypothetical protein
MLPQEDDMNKPALFVATGVILVIALAVSVLRAEGTFSGDDIASLIGIGVMMTLMSSFVLAQARGSLTNTLRDLLIWGMIVAVVTIAYANKAKLGF